MPGFQSALEAFQKSIDRKEKKSEKKKALRDNISVGMSSRQLKRANWMRELAEAAEKFNMTTTGCKAVDKKIGLS